MGEEALRDLLARCGEGDGEAVAELVRRYQPWAQRFAFSLLRDEGLAEDAVQEAFVKGWRAMPRFRPDAEFRPWILTIVSNEARNRRRSSRRRDALMLREAAADRGDAAPSPEAAALARDDAEILVRALERLSERDRFVIGYRCLLELSEAETAAALGVRAGTVKSRLSRALARLRAVLAEGEGTP